MENNKLNQAEFISLFSNTRFRYIHDVIKGNAIQGDATLDLSWNDKGYGIFFSVNGFRKTGSATIADILSLNCNFCDIDIGKKDITQEEKSRRIDEKLMQECSSITLRC